MDISADLTVPQGPFDLDDDGAYRRWRDAKLDGYPGRVEDLVVEVRDIAAPTAAEHAALLARCRKANMAVYAAPPGRLADKDGLRILAGRFGLRRLDANTLADDDGITALAVVREGVRSRYIPYTERAIAWHTDGYYNEADRQVQALLLHCVRPAAAGGENRLMDHEIAYLLLREREPGHIKALMRPDALTIPENDEEGMRRPARSGPVFSVDPRTGALHMRYTARGRNAVWADDPAVAAARRALEEVLEAPSPFVFRHRLEPGQGLVSNNVLHDRAAFRDREEAGPRLLYRARYFDRIAGTEAAGREG